MIILVMFIMKVLMKPTVYYLRAFYFYVNFVFFQTHEEAITNLLATVPLISHRNLPLLLYQISNKYRDEMRPRFGLIRSKEFLMKDLYSFDKTHESALFTYEKVNETYEKLLKKIGIDYFKGMPLNLFIHLLYRPLHI